MVFLIEYKKICQILFPYLMVIQYIDHHLHISVKDNQDGILVVFF